MASPMQLDEIDEDLHSRQLAVYGKESMKRMANATVLLLGLKGLGVEVGKNVVLAGVKALVLHDPSPVDVRDLSAQFYLTPEDVGANTADACKERLQQLNTTVAVSVHNGEITQSILSSFQAVVCTDIGLAEAQKINEMCRASAPPVPFVLAQTRGICAQVFCDFGPEFTVFDTDGEQPTSGIVASILPGLPTVVTCVDDERLEFQAGDWVVFSEVKGMTQLNDGVPRQIKTCKAHMFELDCDSSGFSPYQQGGIVTQHKPSKVMKHRTLQECIAEPGEYLLSDFSKLERSQLLHVAFQALDQYQTQKGRLPAPGSQADIEEFTALVEQLNSSLGDNKAEIDKSVLAKFASSSSGYLNPMAAMFGGMVGQEVVKSISGKFTPLNQWFYFDSVESLPAHILPEEEYKPLGSRYDAQIAVLGRSIQEQLSNLKVFLVGAGALGCEFLKNFALIGVGCSENGVVTVTDDDTIEKSNLSRQFLFRDWNIGEAKSVVAGTAAKAINPALHTNLLQNRVSMETEDVFNDAFWTSQNLVVNALDNVNARLYVDSRCVYFQKPLMESGTLGPKCNTQVVIPSMTENYGASRDPPEKSAPMCTLHSFPHNIDHCLTWARSEFEGILEKVPQETNHFLEDPAKYLDAARKSNDATARQHLEDITQALTAECCRSFDDCIRMMRRRFQEYFHNKIAQLTYTFPEDATTSNGGLFWSAPKRFPKVVDFDPSDASHASFLQAGSILLAEVYKVALPSWATDTSAVAKQAAAIEVPAFQPLDGVKIETDPKATEAANALASDDESRISQMAADLEKLAASFPHGYRLAPIHFEKDDDSNYHMDLITGLANMRARNYAIPEVEKFQAKLIAGRIIPAIATTTALATGLVCLEMYKVVQSKKIEDYRNTFANLSLPLFAMAEPLPMKQMSFKDLKWSLWDRWILEGDLTVQEVLDWFSAKDLEAYSISCGPALLYNNIFPKHKERLGTKMQELVQKVGKQELRPWTKHFDVVVACEDADGEDIDVPLVSIKFKS